MFCGAYPEEWKKQLLHALAKEGHTINNPKLRGTAIATFLCKLYDRILNQRFISWYVPNLGASGL